MEAELGSRAEEVKALKQETVGKEEMEGADHTQGIQASTAVRTREDHLSHRCVLLLEVNRVSVQWPSGFPHLGTLTISAVPVTSPLCLQLPTAFQRIVPLRSGEASSNFWRTS